MRTYENKDELKREINKSFEKYISEFDDIDVYKRQVYTNRMKLEKTNLTMIRMIRRRCSDETAQVQSGLSRRLLMK